MDTQNAHIRRTEGKVKLVGSNQDAQAWLEANTFWCSKLHARISYEQCRHNRSRQANGGDVFAGKEIIPQCQGCTDYPKEKKMKCQVCGESKSPTEFPRTSSAKRSNVCETCSQSQVQQEQPEQFISKHGKKKIIKCLECGRELPNHARGLCARCYERFKSAGELDQRYPPQISQQRLGPREPSKTQVKALQIKMNFQGADQVTEALQRQAQQELRTLEAQAAWVLLQWAEGKCDGKGKDHG